ncbi:hypothetical protein FNAPI_13385 [Fusarium napiforme]|uniref:Uncharacterized protein n=1 Tax=Fusarium napiforme TaxID=42672 RepID=A0A8H5MJL5_9HYPO|nr:hypothetical protein FNAPI_13385 [Fusarium napiforme]
MAEHDKKSPDSSPPRAPSLDKSLTAVRKVSPTEAPLPSPPDSLGRARPAAVALPQVLVQVLRELEARPLYPDEDYHKTVLLSWEEFKRAREKIEATFRRFDYDPFKGIITIRMPSFVHDSFAGSFNAAVLAKLWSLKAGDTDTAKFIANIRSILSTDITLDDQRQPANSDDDADKTKKKSPDLQYRHLGSTDSGVVIEVAYSQQAKELKKLAKAYIGGSKGGIKTKADLTPKANGPGSILKVKQDVDAMPFCDAHRRPLNPDHELVLTLHDLAAKKDLLANVTDLPITIRYDELCGFVNEMEELRKRKIQHAEESEERDSVEVELSGSSDIEQSSTDSEQEESPKNAPHRDRTVSPPVGDNTMGRPNVLTRSASKRPAPTDTGTDLHVTKRRRGSKRRRG